jgi:hypothetical protein
VKVSSYPGANSDDRSITGIGFQPDYVIIQRDGNSVPVHKPASTGPSIDASLQFSGNGILTNLIQALEPDGFQVGGTNAVNMNNNTYFYAAFKDFSTTAVTLASFEATGSDAGCTEWRTDSSQQPRLNSSRPSAAGPYERITAC